MIAVLDAEGRVEEIVSTVEGVDLTGRSWREVTEADLLDGARAAQWALVKDGRDAAEQGGCMTPFGAVQTDAKSMTRLAGAVQAATLAKAAAAPFAENWTLADDSVVALTADEMIGLGLAVAGHVSAVFARGRVLRQRIADAQTLADIEAISWTMADPAP